MIYILLLISWSKLFQAPLSNFSLVKSGPQIIKETFHTTKSGKIKFPFHKVETYLDNFGHKKKLIEYSFDRKSKQYYIRSKQETKYQERQSIEIDSLFHNDGSLWLLWEKTIYSSTSGCQFLKTTINLNSRLDTTSKYIAVYDSITCQQLSGDRFEWTRPKLQYRTYYQTDDNIEENLTYRKDTNGIWTLSESAKFYRNQDTMRWHQSPFTIVNEAKGLVIYDQYHNEISRKTFIRAKQSDPWNLIAYDETNYTYDSTGRILSSYINRKKEKTNLLTKYYYLDN